MHTDHKSLEALRSNDQTSETQLLDVSHVVCNTNTPENTCNEVTPYNDTCQSSNGILLRSEVRRIKWEVNTQVMVLCMPLLNAIVTPTFQTLL